MKIKDHERTPLLWALSYGHPDLARFLIEKGADINITNFNGETALMKAASRGYSDIVKLLINKGADVIEREEK